MNIQHLQSILSIDAPDEIKKEMIYSELSKDEDVLLHFVKILRYERDRKQACMFDMQTIISDLDIIHTGKTNNRWNGGMKGVLDRIEPLFKNWKGLIWHQNKGNYEKSPL